MQNLTNNSINEVTGGGLSLYTFNYYNEKGDEFSTDFIGRDAKEAQRFCVKFRESISSLQTLDCTTYTEKAYDDSIRK